MSFKSLKELIDGIQKMSQDYKIYIWGVGVYGNLLGEILNRNHIEWHGYYNNYDNVSVKCLNGKPIKRGDTVKACTDTVYILAMGQYSAVRKQLLSLGIKEDRIICIEDASVLNSIGDSGEAAPTSEKIRAFRNLYLGEKCFIIGNGPSLSIEDLEAIKRLEIKAFASNMIFKCYDETTWRPYFYFCTDDNFIRDVLLEDTTLEYVSRNCQYMFSRASGVLSKVSDKVPNLLLFKSAYPESGQAFEFSTDCSEKVFVGYTVTYAMMQMAVYMGFKEIYLLGMDQSFSIDIDGNGNIVEKKEIKNHSQILGDYPMRGIANTALTNQAYMAAREYVDSHGIKIYNATRGGKLEVFERVDFDKLL